MPQDILINDDGTPVIVNGDFAVGESTLQELAQLFKTHQGNVKHAPLLGCNLTEFVKRNADRDKVNARIAQNMKMDGKDFNDLKHLIHIK